MPVARLSAHGAAQAGLCNAAQPHGQKHSGNHEQGGVDRLGHGGNVKTPTHFCFGMLVLAKADPGGRVAAAGGPKAK